MGIVMEKDKRIRQTKQKLYDTFIEVLKETPIGEICVTELCQRANVNRATFYRHYQDVYCLKEEMEKNLTYEFREAIKNTQSMTSYKELRLLCLRILQFIVAHNDQCILIFRQNNADILFHKFQEILIDEFYLPSQHVNRVDQFGYIFIFSGIINVLQVWLEGKQPVTVEALVDYIVQGIHYGFHLIPEPEETEEKPGTGEDSKIKEEA